MKMRLRFTAVCLVVAGASTLLGTARAQEVTCPGLEQLDPASSSGMELLACLRDIKAEIEGLRRTLEERPPAVPDEVVVASRRACTRLGEPGDWEAYAPAHGRVILGMGETTDDRDETREFEALEERGGAFRHVLTDAEMPSHDHGLSNLGDRDAQGSKTPRAHWDPEKNKDRRTGGAGGDKPHNNMQPFVTLHFCIKRAD